jgi:hypothetical protein
LSLCLYCSPDCGLSSSLCLDSGLSSSNPCLGLGLCLDSGLCLGLCLDSGLSSSSLCLGLGLCLDSGLSSSFGQINSLDQQIKSATAPIRLSIGSHNIFCHVRYGRNHSFRILYHDGMGGTSNRWH